MVPGEYLLGNDAIELNAGRDPVRIRVENGGDRPIQDGSHTHFFEVNRALRFERETAYGRRLDVPRAPQCGSSPARHATSRSSPWRESGSRVA